MYEYTISSIPPLAGRVIKTLIKDMGHTALLSRNQVTNNQKALVVSYQHETFAWVMTNQWLDYYVKLYDAGSVYPFNFWIKHWLGPGTIEKPSDITPETWAKHVLVSYNHIGKYAPLIGSFEEGKKALQNDSGVVYEIQLETLIREPEKTLDQLSMILGKDIPSDIKDKFLTMIYEKKQEMKPWMDAILTENKGTQNLTINHFGYTIQLLID